MDEDIHLPLHCPQVTPVLLLIVPISFQLSTKENFWDIGKKKPNQQKQPLVQACLTTFLLWHSRCEQWAGTVASRGNYTLCTADSHLPRDVTGAGPRPCHCSAVGSFPTHSQTKDMDEVTTFWRFFSSPDLPELHKGKSFQIAWDQHCVSSSGGREREKTRTEADSELKEYGSCGSLLGMLTSRD